jgi:acetylglutamate kinase
VNHGMLAAFATAGVPACGISGVDGGCLTASRANGGGPDLGLVGRIDTVKPALFEALTAGGFVALLAPLAISRSGQILNVNADEVAVACAAGWLADRLIFLTDVDGVLGADGALVHELSPKGIGELIREGVATGGMLAKLRSAAAAVGKGVPEVEIVGGRQPRILRRLLAGEMPGTAVRPDNGPSFHSAGALNG